jgi:Zn-dependent protease
MNPGAPQSLRRPVINAAMKSGHELFRLLGIPVRIHTTLIVIAAVLALLALAEGGSAIEVAARLLAPLILFGTVVAHEVAHALVARRLDVRVVDIVLTPFGGAARLEGEIREGHKEAIIAAAGPGANLIICAIAFVGLAVAGDVGALDFRQIFLLDRETTIFYDASPLTVVFAFNLLLGTLNLIPAFPMDGGRILRGLLAMSRGRLEATRVATRIGLWFALAFCFAPAFLEGRHWWIMPVIGVFLIYSGLKERILVEAREGFLEGVAGGGSSSSRRRGPFIFRTQRRSRAPEADAHSGPAPTADPDGVIDVSGTSRRLDRPEGSDNP